MVTSRVVRSAVGALALAATACTGATYRAQASAPNGPTRVSDVGLRHIEGNALARETARSLYDVLTYVWPNIETPPWQLRTAALRETDRVGVYGAGGLYLGGLDQLRDITAARIASVRRITPDEEYMQYGRQHAAGALVIEWAKGIR